MLSTRYAEAVFDLLIHRFALMLHAPGINRLLDDDAVSLFGV